MTGFSGVIVMEAVKQVRAYTGERRKVRVFTGLRPVTSPSPALGSVSGAGCRPFRSGRGRARVQAVLQRVAPGCQSEGHRGFPCHGRTAGILSGRGGA